MSIELPPFAVLSTLFFRGSKLLTVAVLWTPAKTANRGSFQKVQFCGRISTTLKSVHKTAKVCRFVTVNPNTVIEN